MAKSLFDKSYSQMVADDIAKVKLEVILNMIGEGFDENTIAKITNLTTDQVREITKKYIN